MLKTSSKRCTAAVTVLMLMTASPGVRADEPRTAEISPSSMFDITVRQRPGTEHLEVVNNTQLYMSAAMTDLDRPEGAAVQAHAKALDPAGEGDWLIGPQSGPLMGFWESVQSYDQPAGRNVQMTLITAGCADTPLPITGSEASLSHQLFGRTVADQIALPVLINLAGLNDTEIQGLGHIVYDTLLRQNNKLLQDIRNAVRTGESYEALRVVWNAIVRDYESVGPLTRALVKRGINFQKRVRAYLARKALTSLHPYAKGIDLALDLLDGGSTYASALLAIHDLGTTPPRLDYYCYFGPGVSAMTPHAIRVDGEDKQVIIHGHGLAAEGEGTPTVRFAHGGNPFFETRFDRVANQGGRGEVTLPARLLENMQKPITATVQFADETKTVPGEIQITQRALIHRVVPDHAYPGQVVKLEGEAIYPYHGANTVIMTTAGQADGRELDIVRISRSAIHARIPTDLAGTPATDWRIHVAERHGSVRKTSDPVPLTLQPGTWLEAREVLRQERMTEIDRVFEGVLTPADDKHNLSLTVPAGVQVVVTLEELRGTQEKPDYAGIAEFELFLEATNEKGERVRRHTSRGAFQISGAQPNTRLLHTTAGDRGVARYWIYLNRWYADEVHYKVRVRTLARDDGGTGLDAPSSYRQALELPVGEIVKAHLFGESEQVGEDYVDYWRVSDVPAGQELIVEMTDMIGRMPHEPSHAGIARIRLYREIPGPGGNATYEAVAESDIQLTPTSPQTRLSHQEEADRSYVVRVSHWYGNVEYHLRATLRY